MMKNSVLLLSVIGILAAAAWVYIWNIIVEIFYENISSADQDVETEEMLDGAESQNYGYGYGTKV